MVITKLKLQLTMLFCLLVLASPAMSFTRELTAAELQTQLSGQFPVRQQTAFMTVTLSDPRVILNEGSDLIGLELTVLTTALGNIESTARGLVDGQLHYQPETGEFFLLRPEVRRLHVVGVAEQYQNDIKMMVDGVAKEALSRMPIYTLKEDDTSQSMAKSFLKSVTVRNGKLILELGFF